VRKEQAETNTLDSLPKQVISGMEKFRGKYHRPFKNRKKAIDGCGSQRPDTVEMLQLITSQ